MMVEFSFQMIVVITIESGILLRKMAHCKPTSNGIKIEYIIKQAMIYQ